MKFWKAYFNLMYICFNNNGKIFTLITFSNPFIILLMFRLYLELHREYGYEY